MGLSNFREKAGLPGSGNAKVPFEANMRISEAEVMKVASQSTVPTGEKIGTKPQVGDEELVAELIARVNAMPDREDRIAEVKAELEAGYNPSSAEVAESILRRTIADRVR